MLIFQYLLFSKKGERMNKEQSSTIPEKVHEFFPYKTIRPNQDLFIKSVFNSVKAQRSILIEGNNGLGKTISSLSACLPIAVEKDLKILYVARTHRQHDRVIEELRAISRKHKVSGISIRGRNHMCLNNFASKNANDSKSHMEICELLKTKSRCPYHRNPQQETYDYLRLQQQISMRPYKSSEIQTVCRKKKLCSYELVKSSLSDIKVIALSYLYVFDPIIRNAFLKNLETQLKKIILIVDEAHNLPETAINISSRSLSLFVLRQAELEAKKFGNKDITFFANFMKNEIEELTANIRGEQIIPPKLLLEMLQKHGDIANPIAFFNELHEVGNAIKRKLLSEGKNPRSYIHGMSEFLINWLKTIDEESFINLASTYFTREKVRTAKLEIVALDPSKITSPVFSSTYSNVIMSGTLQPLQAYALITKLPENTVQSLVPSPFPKENVLPIVCLGLSTALQKRTKIMYKTMIRRIVEVVNNTPANTGIFTASFRVLSSLINEGLERALDKPLFHEYRGMSSKMNEKLVADFKTYSKNGGAVFLGVQGGRTSEGVDFPGNQMNSVIVVGVPYAEPKPRVKAQISYYEKLFPRRGQQFGYLLPAMKKASQSAGRPIRTLKDKGAIIFLDYRFATYYCRAFLPSWMSERLKVLPNEDEVLSQEIREFFKYND
jgi:DNA excision repair protein ERCC-2